MGKHSIKVLPGTPNQGATARHLLQQPFVKLTAMKCPLCDTLIPIPGTLEPQIRALATQLGGDTAYITYEIKHPGDMAETTSLKTYELDSPEAKQLRSRSVQDIQTDDNKGGATPLPGN